MNSLRAILFGLAVAQFGSVGRADWPQFRGPTGQGLAAEAKLPLHWSDTDHVTWNVDIPGKAWSSPVVLGNRVWLTTAVQSQPTPDQIREQLERSKLDAKKFERRQVAGTVKLYAICVDLRTGKMLKQLELFAVDSPEAIHVGNTYASPTPCVEDGRLYVHFGINGTACIDTDSGKVLWHRSIPVFYSVGAGSSPVIYEDLLVLVCDGVDKQFIIALEKDTGETVWKTNRPPIRNPDGQHKKAYSTPLIVRDGDQHQMIIPGAQWVVSYDPITGRELWRADYDSGFSNVPRPVYSNGTVYICTGFGRPQLWAIRTDGRGDVTSTHVVWKEKNQIPANPSPVLVGDLLFVISDKGIASCFDAINGATVWKARIGGNHSASPLYANGHIYFFSQEGETTVVRADREFVEVSRNRVDGQIMASPAVDGDALILRTDRRLYRIE